MNGRWCVRCSRKGPTPYLRQRWPAIRQMLRAIDRPWRVLDLGCGTGRNLGWLPEQGRVEIEGLGIDLAINLPGIGIPTVLGTERWPVYSSTVDVVLANYVFMFLSPKERKQVLQELTRVTHTGSYLMIELYPAKDSQTPTDKDCAWLLEKLIKDLRKQWLVIHRVKNRCLLRRWKYDS